MPEALTTNGWKHIFVTPQQRKPPVWLKAAALTASTAPVVVILAGCSSTDESSYVDFGGGVCNLQGAQPNKGTYKDGTYHEEGRYLTHVTEEKFSADVTLKNGLVDEVTVTPDTENRRSLGLQKAFAAALPDTIHGCPIESVNIHVVGGASLTSASFNEMADNIREKARD